MKFPDIMAENGGDYTMSRSFIKKWVKQKLNWVFRKPCSDAGKLPRNWQDMGKNTFLRLDYLTFLHHIPPELVINADQTSAHLQPVGNERTYAVKGQPDVSVKGRQDKRQVTCLNACSANGDFLPGQIIFAGRTSLVVPKGHEAPKLKGEGWDLTQTENHWSSVETMQRFVEHIYVPYINQVCDR
jgi:hypothetical protein